MLDLGLFPSYQVTHTALFFLDTTFHKDEVFIKSS